METATQQNDARPATTAVERHFSVGDVAELWSLSTDTVRRIFENEPGVVFFGPALTVRGRRRYRTLRIPQSVVDRVHRRNSVAPKTASR